MFLIKYLVILNCILKDLTLLIYGFTLIFDLFPPFIYFHFTHPFVHTRLTKETLTSQMAILVSSSAILFPFLAFFLTLNLASEFSIATFFQSQTFWSLIIINVLILSPTSVFSNCSLAIYTICFVSVIPHRWIIYCKQCI